MTQLHEQDYNARSYRENVRQNSLVNNMQLYLRWHIALARDQNKKTHPHAEHSKKPNHVCRQTSQWIYRPCDSAHSWSFASADPILVNLAFL